ncbi:MAG: glutathione S-transferase N-terminal domain-containing protein [Parvularculaceae bacterium]
MRTLYEIGLADKAVRPSPFCWTVKLALKHKGLEFETMPLGFAEKENYPAPEYGKVPVLVDDGEQVKDSAVILYYLDAKYPQHPLAKSGGEKAAADFIRAWAGVNIFPSMGVLVMPALFAASSEADQTYMRNIFEQRMGMKVEDYMNAPGAADNLAAALKIMAAPLSGHRFFGGDAPNIADYVAFGPFMWARAASRTPFCEMPQPVADWTERMLDLFGGYARAAKSLS